MFVNPHFKVFSACAACVRPYQSSRGLTKLEQASIWNWALGPITNYQCGQLNLFTYVCISKQIHLYTFVALSVMYKRVVVRLYYVLAVTEATLCFGNHNHVVDLVFIFCF